MYARRSGDKDLTFDFAEGLINNNLLIVDRETDSVWSQLENKAVSGPLKGSPLTIVPAVQTTWKFWRKMHPATRVTIVKGETGRPYRYFGSRREKAKSGRRLPKHDVSNLGLGVAYGHDALFLPFTELDKGMPFFGIALGGRLFWVRFQTEGKTAWVEDEKGHLVPSVIAYRQGWMAFHPASGVYSAGITAP